MEYQVPKLMNYFNKQKKEILQLLAGSISMEIHKAQVDYANSSYALNVKQAQFALVESQG